MKQPIRMLLFTLVVSATVLSACGGATSVTVPAGAKVEAAEVAFTGVIEAMSGTQWIVNGQTITVDPTLVHDGPFAVGDMVKVEAQVNSDGSITVTRVEDASASGGLVQGSAPLGSDNTNSSGAPLGSSAGTQSGLVIDDSGTEAFGSVEAISADTIIIGGQTFTIASGAEFKNQIAAGDFVKVHFVVNADGTLSITEIELSDPALVGNDNSNLNDNTNDDDNSNDDNSNDDNSNDDDDNSNGDDDDNSNGDDD